MPLIIFIKTRRPGKSGKNKIVLKFLSNPTSTCTTENERKYNLGSNQQLTNPAFRCQTQRREGHSTFEPGPAGNTLQIGRSYTVILQTPMDELRPLLDMSNYCRSRWKNSLNRHDSRLKWPCTTYIALQHNVDDTTRNSDQRKALPPNTLGAREAEGDIQQLTPHRIRILKDWENKCIIASK